MPPVRAVIADDAADVRLALRTMLEARSDIVVVAEAADGPQAIEAVLATGPDVLLLDLSLPVVDGLAVLRRLHDVHPGVAVVVLSGYGRDGVAAAALELGAAASVEKGGATRGLLETLEELFPGRIGAARGRRATAPVATAPVVIAPVTTVRPPSGADGPGLVPQTVRLAELVRVALPDLRRLAGDHPLELLVDDDALVAADPLRLRQVLENLVSNAARTSAGGAPMEIVVGSHDGLGALLVVDHGPGVDDDAMHELFRPFARADRPDAVTGLGLYVAQCIARAHGGDLVLARTGGQGSTFRMTLPMAEVPAEVGLTAAAAG